MAQNSGAAAGGPRSKHPNGSVLCDKWYRYDGCSRRPTCKLLHNKGSALVPTKSAPKISGSRGAGTGGNSSLASDRPVFVLPEMPKARENDKASSIAKPKAVPDQPGRSGVGERGGIASQVPAGPAFHTNNPRRENNRGSHLTQERSTAVRGDNKAGAVNAPRPPPKPPVTYSDHVHSIAYSKERDWRNRGPLLVTHGTRTAPREAKVELSQLDDESGDSKNDGGVSLEVPGPRALVVDTPPPNLRTTKQKDDVAGNTGVDNGVRSISTRPTKTACEAKPAPRGSSRNGSSLGDGCSSRSPRALIPAMVNHERVMTSDAGHSIEESRTIGKVIEPKPSISNSLEKFLKTPSAESFGRNVGEGEPFQVSGGGVRLLDKFARQYASDPAAIQEKYGHLAFLLQADPRRDFSQLRYTVETHRSMFWQLDPVRLRGIDFEKVRPEETPRNEVIGDFFQKTSSGISIPDQDSSRWEPRDDSRTHRHRNQVARTASEYNASTDRPPHRPAEIAPREHGGGYPPKNRFNRSDRARAVPGGRGGACSGNRHFGQSQVIPVDADRVPLGEKGSASSDHSGVTTMVSAGGLTGTDRAVVADTPDLTTLKHEGLLCENNATLDHHAGVPEHANGEFSKRSEEREILSEPVAKKQAAEEVCTPCGEPSVIGGVAVPPSPKGTAHSIGPDPSSLASSPPSGPTPLLGMRQESTGSNDEEPLTTRKAGDCVQVEGKLFKSNASIAREISTRTIANDYGMIVPQKPEKALGPPDSSQMSCFASRDEAKMALAVNLQKPGQFTAKGEADRQQSDSEMQEVPSWMNESDSGNETPSVWEWDWDKKSSQTGLTDDEWGAGVPLDQANVESFYGATGTGTGSPVSPVGRVFELPEDPGSFPEFQKQEARKLRCAKKYRAKEPKESSRASEGNNCEPSVPVNNASEPQAPGNNAVKQPVPEHKVSKPPVPGGRARKPPVSHHKVTKPPVPVNRANEAIACQGVNGKLVASEGYNRSSTVSRNNRDAGAPISRGRSLGGCGGIKKLPDEVLHAIFSFAADGVLPEVQVKTKDLTYGCGFEAPSTFNKVRYKGLWSVLRTCHHWRTLSQEILYKYVNLSDWSNLELFARTVSHNQDMGALVRSLRISVRPFSPQASYKSYNNRDRNSRAAVVEQVDAFHLLSDILGGCSLIHVMSIDMPNAVPAFNKLVSMQGFPNLREIRMKDGGGRIATGERVWENIIRNTPELKKLVITQDQDLSLRNAPTVIRIPENIFHSEKESAFKLTQIRLTRSYEISDDMLLLLCGKLRNLNDLDIVDCPLVTSRGIARMLEKMPNQLTRLSFWIWINHYGNVSKREQDIGVDLCHALSKYGQSLQHMDIKIFLACHHLWQDGFRELKRCRIVPFHYHDCVKQENVRSSSFFKNVLDKGRNAGKFPALTECMV
ncbi:unnamed protein product [Tuber aestivum]|uniref:Uncharacterized protein n=1 Tax=Tuber aestivum TaxID=59557 RepID=A0A292PZ84_9PEZI|nr:unnamed protein product [Tuber aestivum]